jgi:hypothetical protein
LLETSRWCDRSIRDVRHSVGPSGTPETAALFGTPVAETILASGHGRPHQQAGHMIASDPIRSLPQLLQAGGRPHMGPGSSLADARSAGTREGGRARSRISARRHRPIASTTPPARSRRGRGNGSAARRGNRRSVLRYARRPLRPELAWPPGRRRRGSPADRPDAAALRS